MTTQPPGGRALLGPLGLAGLVVAGACTSRVALGPEAVAGKTPDGAIEPHEVQVTRIGSGGTGGGILHHRGRSNPFGVGGAGVGGIGPSTIDGAGEAYDLTGVARFPGTYGQARYGFALGGTRGGETWSPDEAGVVIRLEARHGGPMPSPGGDAIMVSMR